MVPDNVLRGGLLHVSMDAVQMEKPLPALGVHGILKDRQKRVKLLGDQNGVDHFALGGAGMYIAPTDSQFCPRCVEGLVLQLAEFPAVHRVGKVRAEDGQIKEVSARSDLLIGRKSDSDPAVRNFGVCEKVLRHRHDLGDTCLVVRSEQGRAVRHDEVLPPESLELGKVSGGENGFFGGIQQNIAAVIVLHDPGLRACVGHCRRGIHMGDQPQHRRVLAAL